MKNPSWLIPVVIFFGYGLGALIFSQGASFARWDAVHQPSYFVNFHAGLLFAAGLAIILLTIGVGFLSMRVNQLERTLKESRRQGA